MSTPSAEPSAQLVAELVAVARQVAVAAGRLVHDGRPETVGVAATKSSAVDVVTAMDLASEELVRAELARLRPADGILGEEGGHVPGTSGVTWVVDPIDGTVNYLYGLPAYAVSVAAVVGEPAPGAWTVLAGCVHAPATGETWTAGRGQGAHLDGRPLTVAPAPPLDRCLLGTGFGYVAERRRAQARVLADLLPRVRDVRRAGAAAIDLCQVATGRLDLYYERGLQPWDLAAAGLVVAEAGGVVTGLRGRAAGPDMVVAGAAERVAELVALLEELHADAPDSPSREGVCDRGHGGPR
ncbi:inositol monophosphatase [Cellulomonas sp. zg-ZUI222]|uniref:Inositol-1-monophosphatase n=1 Tax=Cellulomonas wangleii TaxID=2816956 RepID=A0ABX8DC42_9CELL|nr:inositol monophosphatase family protein [Cellulomonas wangleii]MBO0922657.1 inositol monophosphatase [Cellulomonas wangleii]MBO0926478.1 inositol monophosphatase [Cellulomonas wangleii]QVI63857.1 inositol monophosphatase [Cellulomonas wangleii]